MDSEIKSMNELKKQHKRKQELKHVAFEQILYLILRKINDISTMLSKNIYVYQVPEVLLGYPLYDIMDCCNWLKKSLLKKGVTEVEIMEPNIMVIKWDL